MQHFDDVKRNVADAVYFARTGNDDYAAFFMRQAVLLSGGDFDSVEILAMCEHIAYLNRKAAATYAA